MLITGLGAFNAETKITDRLSAIPGMAERRFRFQAAVCAEVLHQRAAELETADVERQLVQTALQVSETRYRRLFETAQNGY